MNVWSSSQLTGFFGCNVALQLGDKLEAICVFNEWDNEHAQPGPKQYNCREEMTCRCAILNFVSVVLTSCPQVVWAIGAGHSLSVRDRTRKQVVLAFRDQKRGLSESRLLSALTMAKWFLGHRSDKVVLHHDDEDLTLALRHHHIKVDLVT